MDKPRIPIARPDIGERERDYMRWVMTSGWITQGPAVERAQELLCEITGRKYALCVSNGTMALIVALLATDRGERPRNIAVPALTFAAVHNAVRFTGGQLNYLGTDWNTWQAPDSEARGKTFDDAIIAPCYGKVAIEADIGFATRNVLIEDAAESFGGSFNGRPAGSLGDVSCISFYANKIVTSGEGGAVLTDDTSLHERMRLIINHGIADKSYVPLMPGLNGRMADLQAAVLCAQLDRMPEMLRRRRDIVSAYNAASGGRWRLPVIESGEIPAPWLFAGIPENRQRVIEICQRENVEWRPIFPIPKDAPNGQAMANARNISELGICLPLSSAMTDDEVERVIGVILA